MAYNITKWKTKELVDLVIPLWTLVTRKDFQPEVIPIERGVPMVSYQFCDSRIEGEIVDDFMLVRNISVRGEGSGTLWNWILQSALAHSKGKLVAARVWEGGDAIDIVNVVDGKMWFDEVDL